MNYTNEKENFHHSQKLLVKRRIMKSLNLENICEGVYICSSKFCELGLCIKLSPIRSIFEIYPMSIISRIRERMKYSKKQSS